MIGIYVLLIVTIYSFLVFAINEGTVDTIGHIRRREDIGLDTGVFIVYALLFVVSLVLMSLLRLTIEGESNKGTKHRLLVISMPIATDKNNVKSISKLLDGNTKILISDWMEDAENPNAAIRKVKALNKNWNIVGATPSKLSGDFGQDAEIIYWFERHYNEKVFDSAVYIRKFDPTIRNPNIAGITVTVEDFVDDTTLAEIKIRLNSQKRSPLKSISGGIPCKKLEISSETSFGGQIIQLKP